MNFCFGFSETIVYMGRFYWTKVLYADRPCSSTLIGQLLKVKNYEVTKLHTNSWRNLYRWSRVELDRIRAAGAIAGHEHNNLGHRRGAEASEW
jgi:hypothetical protein